MQLKPYLWRLSLIGVMGLTLSLWGLNVPTTHAQTAGEVIVLNDSTPSVDMIVEIPAGTSGVIRLELLNATVLVLNQSGQQVLAADSGAIRELEIQFGANSPAHSITVQRLANAATGYLRVTATPSMSVTAANTPPTTYTMPIDTPTQNIPLDFAGNLAGVVEIQALENYASSQIFDANNANILSLYSGSIQTLRAVLVGSRYQLNMNNVAGYATLAANVSTGILTNTSQLMQPSATIQQVSNTTLAACTGTVNFERVNQRSGPGTVYTVTGDAAQGTVLQIGGVDTSREWLLVGTDYGSAWMYVTYLDLAGDCSSLPTY